MLKGFATFVWEDSTELNEMEERELGMCMNLAKCLPNVREFRRECCNIWLWCALLDILRYSVFRFDHRTVRRFCWAAPRGCHFLQVLGDCVLALEDSSCLKRKPVQ